MYDEVESRGAVVIAVAQEDTDGESHAKFLRHFEGGPRFELAYDAGRERTARYERTSTYLIDREGIVRQEFPSLLSHRPDWTSVFGELDRVRRERDAG